MGKLLFVKVFRKMFRSFSKIILQNVFAEILGFLMVSGNEVVRKI